MIFSETGIFTPSQIKDYLKPKALPNEVQLDCILLVDDDRATNFLNRRLLDKMAVAKTIKVARNGIEAMEYLTRGNRGHSDFPLPNLILLDINMPLVNGWEFLERYETLPNDLKRHITLLMLTTSLRQDDLGRVEETPSVKGFIHKPLSEQEVRKVLLNNFAS